MWTGETLYTLIVFPSPLARYCSREGERKGREREGREWVRQEIGKRGREEDRLLYTLPSRLSACHFSVYCCV